MFIQGTRVLNHISFWSIKVMKHLLVWLKNNLFSNLIKIQGDHFKSSNILI
jgi:hypothetical protein